MNERLAESATAGLVMMRVILATLTMLLLAVAKIDLAAVDPYAFCWNYLRAWIGF